MTGKLFNLDDSKLLSNGEENIKPQVVNRQLKFPKRSQSVTN